MDYGKVLSRAWQITWHWKVLWVLGFLAALGSGNGGGNFNFTLGGLGEEARGITAPGPEWIGLVIAVIALAFLIGIALWVVSIIASGGLVAGVQQVEEEESTAFGRLSAVPGASAPPASGRSWPSACSSPSPSSYRSCSWSGSSS